VRAKCLLALVLWLSLVAVVWAQVQVSGFGGFPPGTAAAPGAFWFGDEDTGFFSYGAGIIGWTSNGSQKGVLSSNESLTSAGVFAWTSGADPGSGADTAWGRSSAGSVKLTNAGTTIRGLYGGGGALASATALPVPSAGLHHVTGVTTITSITSTNLGSGVCIVLIFDGVLTFTDGSNLVLAGNFTTAANSTISLCYDGTSWFETARATN